MDSAVTRPEAERDERELGSGLRRADIRAFEEIVLRYRGVVYGYLRARVARPSDAEDLAQDVFLRLHATRRRFDARQPLRPWILGIARNVLREHVRRAASSPGREVTWTELCLDIDALAARRSDDDSRDDAILHLPDCLDSLGPSARQAIDLRYSSSLRIAEIGRRLRRSEGAVKLLMHRARRALRRCLEGKSRHEATDG